MQRFMLYLRRTVFTAVVGYVLICAGMFALQRQLLYHPASRDIALDVALVPGARVQDLTTPDGETLKLWWVPPANPGKPVYLYFPGNADTLAERDERFGYLVSDGGGLLALSWRGFGGSTGSPGETALKADALLAYNWLRETVAAPRIIIFGESLGTGVAVWLSSEVPSGALVLDSAYTTIADAAKLIYPWLPVRQLLLDHYDSLSLAQRINVPVLALHCRDDRLIPFALGQQLFEAFPVTDKHLEVIPRRCHVPSIAPIAGLLRQLEEKVSDKPG